VINLNESRVNPVLGVEEALTVGRAPSGLLHFLGKLFATSEVHKIKWMNIFRGFTNSCFVFLISPKYLELLVHVRLFWGHRFILFLSFCSCSCCCFCCYSCSCYCCSSFDFLPILRCIPTSRRRSRRFDDPRHSQSRPDHWKLGKKCVSLFVPHFKSKVMYRSRGNSPFSAGSSKSAI
jgi:hypothetical protein